MTATNRARRAIGFHIGRAHAVRERMLPPARTIGRWLRPASTVADPAWWGSSTHRGPDDPRVRVGDNVHLGDQAGFVLGPNALVDIGAGTWAGRLLLVTADRAVRIGAGCRIGPGVAITDTWGPEPAPGPEPVVIGDGCTLGANVIVGPGIRLPPGTEVPPGAVLHRGSP